MFAALTLLLITGCCKAQNTGCNNIKNKERTTERFDSTRYYTHNEKAQREAHADSLMQVRAQQEAQAADAQRKDAQRQSICKFVKSFYQKAVLEADDPTFYERYLTPYCRQMIFGVDADNNDVDKWSAWWGAFGTTADRPDYEALQRNLNVTPGEGNWYNVRLTQDGTTEYRQIKVSTVDGHVLIDDVR